MDLNTFGRDIYNGTITLKEADEDGNSLLVEIMNFERKIKPQHLEKKLKKRNILKNFNAKNEYYIYEFQT